MGHGRRPINLVKRTSACYFLCISHLAFDMHESKCHIVEKSHLDTSKSILNTVDTNTVEDPKESSQNVNVNFDTSSMEKIVNKSMNSVKKYEDTSKSNTTSNTSSLEEDMVKMDHSYSKKPKLTLNIFEALTLVESETSETVLQSCESTPETVDPTSQITPETSPKTAEFTLPCAPIPIEELDQQDLLFTPPESPNLSKTTEILFITPEDMNDKITEKTEVG